MAVEKDLGAVSSQTEVLAMAGKAVDAATVATMLDEHARLRSLLKDAIMAASEPECDYWIGIGLDEVVVRGDSPQAVMAAIEADGLADGTVVIEFVSSDPQVIVL